jgi:hypothetical protein
MHVVSLIVGVALAQQPVPNPTAPRLNVRAERGLGGLQSDGWQHIALRIENSSGQPIAGQATLYEWESQVGARPRIVAPFAVTDRQVLHLYPFRPPETPQPSSYVITLEDAAGRPIPFDGGSQFVIAGQSTRAIRVDMGSGPTADFRVAVWGDASPFLRAIVNEWTPSVDDLYRAGRAPNVSQWQRSLRGSGRISPEAVSLEDARMFPDSYVGFGDLNMLIAVGVDLDDQLTERQRRALSDWVRSGGILMFLPRKPEHLAGPFFGELIGIQARGELTTLGDRHLRLSLDAGTPHQIVHFITELDPPRKVDVLASYEMEPVVYSVPAGYGRVWIVAFDPDAHGGVRRYKPLWTDMLNQSVKYKVTEGMDPAGLASQTWSPDADRKWLATLGERFGNSPSVEHLAILILCYLLVVGPANFLVLKRREARVWLIGTVPILAAVFGVVVLSMGYLSHGLRAATNYLALGVVTPEGDRAFTQEFIAVYGTTSAEYTVEFPRYLPVRPLGEYVPNPNGGFENPGSFKLQVRDDRQWLRDWRLTFWQTRGMTSLDCVPFNGRLTAHRSGSEVTVENETDIAFDSIVLAGGGQHQMGPLRPFQSATVQLSHPELWDLDGRRLSAETGGFSQRVGQSELQRPGSAAERDQRGSAHDQSSLWPDDEARALFDAAATQVRPRGGDWVFGLTRQPVHSVKSPDTKRPIVATVYVWPVVTRGDQAGGTQ